MISIYKDNIYNICDLIKKILGVKNSNKITFDMLTNTFDSDMDDNKLVNKVLNIIKDNPKMIEPACLLLMLGESFEYFVKYEDKYETIKKRLMSLNNLREMANGLMDDMWPFYPLFEEALSVFATLLLPDMYGGVTDIDLVLESQVREFIFIDDEGYILPITFQQFFTQSASFIKDTYDIEYKLTNESSQFNSTILQNM